jgi:hypothetical protein
VRISFTAAFGGGNVELRMLSLEMKDESGKLRWLNMFLLGLFLPRKI